MSGCADDGATQRPPQGPGEGITLTGRLEGRAVSVSDGAPEVLLGDCDRAAGPDSDLCIVTRTIDGARIGLVLENPAVMRDGGEVPVRAGSCTDCDDVVDHAVVDLRTDGSSLRAVGGSLRTTAAGPRRAAQFRLRFHDGGEVTGRFNVRPPGVVP